ncbi:type I polyketide synthase, partial [Streptomyces lasiicapitis]|uniref:type I polyketide synthase n=1 Tax=Streptomyces lasiicapitis TaxID=1923961 RepID=UPI0036901896
LHYGAAFQGLKRCWRLVEGAAAGTDGGVDGDLYVEVELPEGAGAADRYGLHPALFDAALHAAALVAPSGADQGEAVTRLPFAWSGVSLHATGATRLRARIRFTGTGALSVTATDPAGHPVVTVESLGMRPVSVESLRRTAAMADASLLRLEWGPGTRGVSRGVSAATRWAWIGADAGAAEWAEALGARGIECVYHPDPEALRAYLDTGGSAPDVVVLAESPPSQCADPHADTDMAAAAHRATHRVLAAVQDWLDDERLAESRLVVVTRGAVAPEPGSAPDPALAAVWGLVASAQSEHPDRIRLVDVDGLDASWSALPDVVAGAEAQVAVRAGALMVPRLARVAASASQGGGPLWDTDGTVLVTGGLGTLGRLVVRHLAESHGVRHVVVVSRSGESGAGAAEFVKELRAGGTDIRVVTVDVGERAALEGVLGSIPAEHPLTAVVHLAGVLDDGVLQAQTPERVDRVLRPKADGAWHLHELTGTDVAFVAFSSVSSVLGPAGQAGYAAANAFVDALVARRRAVGLPGLALGWGLWGARSGLTEGLGDADVRRMARSGVKALSSDQGLALFDLACATGEPVVYPLRLDIAGLGGRSSDGAGGGDDVPPLLRGLARTPVRRAAVASPGGTADTTDGDSLATRLARLPEPEQDALLLHLVRTHVAAVLGYDDPGTVGERRPFADIGFDSLRALQLRNRLGGGTGLRLSATLVFDYPTPAALAQHLRALLLPDAPPATPAEAAVPEQLRSASREEVFDYIDNLLGE